MNDDKQISIRMVPKPASASRNNHIATTESKLKKQASVRLIKANNVGTLQVKEEVSFPDSGKDDETPSRSRSNSSFDGQNPNASLDHFLKLAPKQAKDSSSSRNSEGARSRGGYSTWSGMEKAKSKSKPFFSEPERGLAEKPASSPIGGGGAKIFQKHNISKILTSNVDDEMASLTNVSEPDEDATLEDLKKRRNQRKLDRFLKTVEKQLETQVQCVGAGKKNPTKATRDAQSLASNHDTVRRQRLRTLHASSAETIHGTVSMSSSASLGIMEQTYSSSGRSGQTRTEHMPRLDEASNLVAVKKSGIRRVPCPSSQKPKGSHSGEIELDHGLKVDKGTNSLILSSDVHGKKHSPSGKKNTQERLAVSRSPSPRKPMEQHHNHDTNRAAESRHVQHVPVPPELLPSMSPAVHRRRNGFEMDDNDRHKHDRPQQHNSGSSSERNSDAHNSDPATRAAMFPSKPESRSRTNAASPTKISSSSSNSHGLQESVAGMRHASPTKRKTHRPAERGILESTDDKIASTPTSPRKTKSTGILSQSQEGQKLPKPKSETSDTGEPRFMPRFLSRDDHEARSLRHISIRPQTPPPQRSSQLPSEAKAMKSPLSRFLGKREVPVSDRDLEVRSAMILPTHEKQQFSAMPSPRDGITSSKDRLMKLLHSFAKNDTIVKSAVVDRHASELSEQSKSRPQRKIRSVSADDGEDSVIDNTIDEVRASMRSPSAHKKGRSVVDEVSSPPTEAGKTSSDTKGSLPQAPTHSSRERANHSSSIDHSDATTGKRVTSRSNAKVVKATRNSGEEPELVVLKGDNRTKEMDASSRSTSSRKVGGRSTLRRRQKIVSRRGSATETGQSARNRASKVLVASKTGVREARLSLLEQEEKLYEKKHQEAKNPSVGDEKKKRKKHSDLVNSLKMRYTANEPSFQETQNQAPNHAKRVEALKRTVAKDKHLLKASQSQSPTKSERPRRDFERTRGTSSRRVTSSTTQLSKNPQEHEAGSEVREELSYCGSHAQEEQEQKHEVSTPRGSAASVALITSPSQSCTASTKSNSPSEPSPSKESVQDIMFTPDISETQCDDSSPSEYEEEDIFSMFSWSVVKQDSKMIQRERRLLRDSIRGTALHRALLAAEVAY